jgi:hypothetical protein
MKKLTVFLASIFLLSCGDDNVSITKKEYDKLRGIKQNIPQYPKKIAIYDAFNNPIMSIYDIDSCEYIAHAVTSSFGLLCHKGNCKFCQIRSENTLRLIIKEELQKIK